MAVNLTPKENEILLLAATGKADKEIAQLLGVTRGTITTHWVRMRERNGASNRAQVIALELARIYRETEAALVRTAQLYQALVENVEDFAIFLMDMDRKILSWNPGVGKILGYEKDEWIGRYGDLLFTPEDQAAGAPEIEQRTAETNGRALDDRWHLRRDGTRFWASGVMVAVRSPQGELLCYSKMLRDLTPLKELEEKLAQALQNVSS